VVEECLERSGNLGEWRVRWMEEAKRERMRMVSRGKGFIE
jgi:hypothetical protein